LTELKEISEFYSKKVHSKDQEIEKLRDYLSRLESSENKLSNEFEKQLKEKDRQIKRLAGILNSGKEKKAGQNEIVELHDKQLTSKKKEIEKLRRHISEMEVSERGLVPPEELSDKEVKIKKLLSILKSRGEENQKLSEQLDNKIITERDYAGKIKNALAKKERSDRNLFESLKEDLDKKRDESERLRVLTLSQDRIIKQLDNQVIEFKKHINQFETFLDEKDRMRDKLESNFSQQLKNKDYEIEQLEKEVGKQVGRKDLALQEDIANLKTKLETREAETEELAKNFANLKEQNRIFSKRLEERQKLFVESENTYNRIVHSLREQHERRLKDVLHKSTQSEIRLRAELDKLKVLQNEKAAVVSDKQKEIDETLLQFAETSKKLLEIKGTEGFSEAYVSAAQLKEKEDYLKKKEAELTKLLKEAAEKVNEANRKESEISNREQMLLKEQEAVNSELAVLKSAGISIGRDRAYLKEKLQEYGTPVEQPQVVPEMVEPQQEITEQEPVVESIEAPEVLEAPEAPAPTPDFTEKEEKDDILGILRKPSEGVVEVEKPSLKGKMKMGFKQARSRSKLLPKPPKHLMKAKVDRPKLKEALIKQAETQDSFPEEKGYGEIQELTSIISIGLQHGDSVEQIKSSLELSGYSKKNIDKAFQEVKR